VLGPLLLVFVASAEVDTDAAATLSEAASQALGAGARVAVKRYQDAPPTDADLASAARAQGAGAAARVIWSDSGAARASIDVYLVRQDVTIHRDMVFLPQDRPAERARAIGLVLASVLMAEETERARAEPDAPMPADANAAAGGAGASDRESPVSAATSNGGDPKVAPGRWALEAFADGGLGLGGAGEGLGGGVAGRRYGPAGWGARLGAHARAGSVASAQASSLAVGLSAGGFRSLLRAGPARASWDLAVRAEVLLLYEALTHFSDDDPVPVRRGRFLPGGAALLEAQWQISPAAALHLATGFELAFGSTRVVVRGLQVAEIAPMRGVIEVGFRARF
jgi:hypothetical protein